MRAVSLNVVKFGFLLLLASCGGSDGFQPSVSQVQGTTLRYGQEAVILVAGKYMRSDMVAETGTCSGPAFRANSGPTVSAKRWSGTSSSFCHHIGSHVFSCDQDHRLLAITQRCPLNLRYRRLKAITPTTGCK